MTATINRIAEHKHTVSRSIFLARVFPAADLQGVKKVIAERTRSIRKARHHCWACRVPGQGDTVIEQARDDGEVGRPGMVLLELLRRHDLLGAIVISRIFGGVKLGPGGVSRAMRSAAEVALAEAQPPRRA